VGTLPPELSSLQLTGEPVMVQREKKPSGARRKRQKKKQEKANAAPQADTGPGARGAHSGESCTGTAVDTGGSSRKKTAVTWWDTSGCPDPGEAY